MKITCYRKCRIGCSRFSLRNFSCWRIFYNRILNRIRFVLHFDHLIINHNFPTNNLIKRIEIFTIKYAWAKLHTIVMVCHPKLYKALWCTVGKSDTIGSVWIIKTMPPFKDEGCTFLFRCWFRFIMIIQPCCINFHYSLSSTHKIGAELTNLKILQMQMINSLNIYI